MSRPRILYVCTYSPAAPMSGTQLRTLHIGRILQRIGDVTMVLAASRVYPAEEVEGARRLFDVARVVRFESRPVRGLRARLAHELDAKTLNTGGFTTSESDRAAVRELAESADASWVNTMQIANALGVAAWPRSLLDLDDVLSRYETERARTSVGTARLIARRRAWLWRRREARIFDRFTAAAVCSAADRDYLGGDPRIHVVPNGFEAPVPIVTPRPNGLRIGFIGVVGYEPNRHGLAWFLSEVWPLVRRDEPRAEFRVVGSGSTGEGAPCGPGVSGLGYVDDPAAEMATWSATIVPLFLGAGTRVKIAEAFARGVPVVSTPLGALGYDVTDERELLLAGDAPGFAERCVRLLRSPSLGAEIAARGREAFDRSHSWDAIAPLVEAAVRDCRRRGAHRV